MNAMTKRIAAWLLAVLCMTLLFASCGDNAGGDQTYTVTLKDAFGTPYTGVVVKFLQDGEQVAMQPCDENGVVSKTLAGGDYTVELSPTDSAMSYYTETELTLTTKKTTLDVVLAKTVSGEPETLSVGAEEFAAYAVSEGATYVELTEGKRSYYLFTPTQAGTYEFSVVNNAKVTLGYYGSPHFVLESNSAELVDGKFTISVSAGMIGTGDGGTSVYVIGVDAADAATTSCVLGIQRTGDPQKTIADEPWTIYETTSELAPYTLPEGYAIKEFDLTASTDTYPLVFNETDGFYHLNTVDGPLVLVRLAEDTDYIACFQTILDRSGVTKYFYDENDAFVRKESYSECLLEYIECVDEAEGVYPLTEDLKYIIQQRGDYVGWWDIESSGYLFKDLDGNNDPSINAEIAWLMMCCYVE